MKVPPRKTSTFEYMTLVEENLNKGISNRDDSHMKIDKTPIWRKSTFQEKEKLNELVMIAGPN